MFQPEKGIGGGAKTQIIIKEFSLTGIGRTAYELDMMCSACMYVHW